MKFDFSSYDNKVTAADIAEYQRTNANSTFVDIIGVKNFTPVLIAPMFAFMFFTSPDPMVLGFGVYVFAIIFIVSVFILTILLFANVYRKEILKRARLSRFANANQMTYSPSSLDRSNNGLIFNAGFERRYNDILQCESGTPFEIANYQYDLLNERHSRIDARGYVKIKLNRKQPHIVLDSKRNNKNILGMSVSNQPVSFDRNQNLSLEGDFDSYFTLYAPQNCKTDALYVFNPMLMALFIDKAGDYDAEIIDDNLYIYSQNVFKLDDRATLTRLLNIIDKVMLKTVSSTRNYSNESVGGVYPKSISMSLRRRRVWQWTFIISAAIVIISALMRLFNIGGLR
jgi:hypothetical protein